MAYKNLSVSADLYEFLKQQKQADESFTEEIYRLVATTKFSELSGTISEKQAEDWRKGVDEVRKNFKVREWR